ncbi:MAG TPA: hypothetical protein VIN73_11895 [Vicingaceae bacterium]
MITGEIAYLYGWGSRGNDEYAYFLKKLFGKKTLEEKAANKNKRKAFWESIGKGYQELGGVEGIVGTAQGVKAFIKSGEQPDDFEVNIGHTKEKEEITEKGISKEVLIMGAVAVFAVGIWGISHYRKNQALKKLAMKMNE